MSKPEALDQEHEGAFRKRAFQEQQLGKVQVDSVGIKIFELAVDNDIAGCSTCRAYV